MNIVLAVVLLAVVLMQGADVLAYLDRPATVGKVQPGSPAERAGIQPGDVITQFGTADMRTLGTPRHGGGGPAGTRSRRGRDSQRQRSSG